MWSGVRWPVLQAAAHTEWAEVQPGVAAAGSVADAGSVAAAHSGTVADAAHSAKVR